MMTSSGEDNLVFADTFDHTSDAFPQVEKCDVIQFSYPVCVSRVSVLPFGEPLVYNHQPQLSGLTNPSNFKLEVFCHDLKTAQSSTRFNKLCDINFDVAFHNHTTQVSKPNCVTDVIIIKGKYKVCSLCVFASVQPFTLPAPPPVPINDKVPHLTGDAAVALSEESLVPTTPTGASLQLPTSLMTANNRKMQLAPSPVKNEMFPLLGKDLPMLPSQSTTNNINENHFHATPPDVAVPPPSLPSPGAALGSDSVTGSIISPLFNSQLPDAIPFAPPMKTPTSPIELIVNSSSSFIDDLHKTAANELETSNIAKELVEMRRERSSSVTEENHSREELSKRSVEKDDGDNQKWIAAANLFLQQAAESAARVSSGTQSTNSAEQKFQELLSMAEKISPQVIPKQSEKASPSTENIVNEPLPHSSESLVPPPVPFSLHQVVPAQEPQGPNPSLPPSLPPGININPAAAMAALAARFPFPTPPFNMGMPPFFNPAVLEQMTKIYSGPAIMSASNIQGMGPSLSQPPGPGGPDTQKVGHVPGMSPQSGFARGPPVGGAIVVDGVGSGINVQLTDPTGSQSSQPDTVASSAEDYDGLSNDEDYEDEFEDISEGEYEIDDEGNSQSPAVDESAISTAIQIKIQAQIALEKEEDLLLETAFNKHAQNLSREEGDKWGDMKNHVMKHFFSPHLFISERIQNGDTFAKEVDKTKMKTFLEVMSELQKREGGHSSQWIAQLESLFNLLLEGLTWLKSKGFDKFKRTVKEIVAHAIMAIDWETALGQNAGDNVRQLKVGCRLITLLAQFGSETLTELLNASVFDNLFKLINQPLMLSAMQLYPLEAINALCCSCVGVKNLLICNGFPRLLSILHTSRCIRINHAVSVIAHKINIYECLQSCLKHTREVIRKIRNSANCDTPCSVDSDGVSQAFVELMHSLTEYPKNTLSTPGNIKKFSPQPYEDFMFRMMHEKELLEQVLNLLASPLLQPSNKLTATLFKLLDWLLSSTNGRSFMFSKRETYLEFIGCMKSASQLDLECDRFKSLETRMKVALKATISVDKLKSVTGKLGEDSSSDTEPVGMRDCFEKIYVLTTKDCDTVCEILKQTDVLNFMARYVANAFSKKNSVASASGDSGAGKNTLAIVETKVYKSKESSDTTAAEETVKTCTHVDSKQQEHPIAFFGICILLKAAQVQDSEIENWAFPLLSMPDVEEAQAVLCVSASTSLITINAQSTRLIELKRWLEPLRDLKAAIKSAAGGKHNSDVPNLSTEFSKVTINHIPHLVDFFKYRIEDFGPRLLCEAPGFITCIRVLMRLLKPHVSKFDEPKVNLSAFVRLFEASGYEIILKLITKGLCESSNCYMWQSHQLMSRLGDETVESCFKLVTPLLQLVKLMVEQIASATDIVFRDMRVIKALLPLHAIMCSRYRLQNKFRHCVVEVQTIIAEIFLIYAKSVTEEDNNNGTDKKELNETENQEEENHMESDLECGTINLKLDFEKTSMGWDLMLKEVLCHIMKLPNCALSGLSLLSELLPLPLPMMSPSGLDENELTRIKENRSNWADHLLLHQNLLQEMLSQFTDSASSNLGSMLRRVAWQVADLNPALAKIVICCFVDSVNDSMEAGKDVWHSKVSLKLQYLDHAVSQPAGKAALMEMLIEDQASEVGHQNVLPCFEKLLSMLELVAPEHRSPNHESILYYIITILQSLCDPSVSLLSFDPTETYIPTHLILSNTPPESVTSRICEVLLAHAAGNMHSMFTFHHALKAVILLCCHDMVFSLVKKYLIANTDTLRNLLVRLHKEPKTQRNEDNLRVFISFINLLRGSNLSEDFLGSDRTIFFTRSELLPLLCAGNSEYSLEKYSEKLMREGVKLSGAAEDCLKALLDYLSVNAIDVPNVNGISNGAVCQMMQSSDYCYSKSKLTLGEQFEKRSIYRISPIDDDRFSPSNWFATCFDEIALDHLINVDMTETCKESLHNFDPVQEFRKSKEVEIQRTNKKHKYHHRKYTPLICKGMKRSGREIVRRPNYLAKEKGVELLPKRSDDVFRLRKQNTSRPPSMHVDDYMMLEKAHNDSPTTVPSTANRRKSRISGTEPGKASPEARKRSRLCDSPSESSQMRRPIPPIVSGSTAAPGSNFSSTSNRSFPSLNGKIFITPEVSSLLSGSDPPSGDAAGMVVSSSANERGFYSAARGWINNVITDSTRGRTGLSKPPNH